MLLLVGRQIGLQWCGEVTHSCVRDCKGFSPLLRSPKMYISKNQCNLRANTFAMCHHLSRKQHMPTLIGSRMQGTPTYSGPATLASIAQHSTCRSMFCLLHTASSILCCANRTMRRLSIRRTWHDTFWPPPRIYGPTRVSQIQHNPKSMQSVRYAEL